MAGGISFDLTMHTQEATRGIQDAASKLMFEAVNEVRNVTLETLSGQRSGRTYFVPGTHRTYTASAPGEAPASATGRLRQSVAASVEGKGEKLIGEPPPWTGKPISGPLSWGSVPSTGGGAQVVGEVGTSLEYGKCLEYGTRSILPRPWLRPSFEKARPAVQRLFEGRKWF